MLFMSILCFLFWLVPSIASVSNDEFQALIDLYNATSREGWEWYPEYYGYGKKWNFDNGTDPCMENWQGID